MLPSFAKGRHATLVEPRVVIVEKPGGMHVPAFAHTIWGHVREVRRYHPLLARDGIAEYRIFVRRLEPCRARRKHILPRHARHAVNRRAFRASVAHPRGCFGLRIGKIQRPRVRAVPPVAVALLVLARRADRERGQDRKKHDAPRGHASRTSRSRTRIPRERRKDVLRDINT